jgi:type I restriction-modification system DNA methylase subunit
MVATDREELEFVLNNLDRLEAGGTCVAIVPITCATAPDGTIAEWKRKIMDRHTLEAVMSLPTELFHNSKTNVVTCVMVFTAHHPHKLRKKTWFGYWRDDGFVKTKHRGRVDLNGDWSKIKESWVNSFKNRDSIPSISITKEVGPEDEWCAEAYLPTDYKNITETALIESIKKHVICQAMVQYER